MSLYVLKEPGTDPQARALASLAGFAGVEARSISAPDIHRRPGEAIHLAATGRSLHAFLSRPESKAWLLRELAAPGSSIFLCGTTADEAVLGAIRSLVPDVAAIHRVDRREAEYHIPAEAAEGLEVFAGLSFGPVDETSHTFEFNAGSAPISVLVSVNGRAAHVKIRCGETSVFLNGCEAPLDIDSPASKTEDILDRFLSFAPFVGYLRTTFGRLCWHNPQPAACVIIDDPLLKPRYGFLDFAKLEAAIDRSSCSTTIAFIPWNYRRSHPAVARRFTRGDRRLSVCIHGCDHTGAEFGSIESDVLRSRARRAMRSMDTHQRLTGISHNRVMVFPQGVFSKASLKALEQEGFAAAVNTTIHPVDAASDEISFQDLMDVAVVRFDGVPLFMRHYPGRPVRFALDLFLGRPVLIVEHHSFFKNGYDTLEWYASFINRIAPDIRWTDLDELCASAYLSRFDSSDDMQIQAFASVVRVVNDDDVPRRVSVVNRWARNDIASVSWNGRQIPFDTAAAICHFELNARERGELRYQRARAEDTLRVVDPTAADRMRVFVRRRLCEFRDNHVATSAALRPLAKVIRPVFSRI